MLAGHPLCGGGRQVDHQRQEGTVEFENIHAQAEGGEILLAGIAQLAQGEFRKGAVVKQLHLIPQPGLGRD